MAGSKGPTSVWVGEPLGGSRGRSSAGNGVLVLSEYGDLPMPRGRSLQSQDALGTPDES